MAKAPAAVLTAPAAASPAPAAAPAQAASVQPGGKSRLKLDPLVILSERVASLESSDFTGRIVEAGGGLLAIAEGWHRGPTVAPEEDPAKLGPIMMDLQKRARKNAGMNGMDLD